MHESIPEHVPMLCVPLKVDSYSHTTSGIVEFHLYGLVCTCTVLFNRVLLSWSVEKHKLFSNI